ncbi:MAG TPA: ABC transporter ATP-binding protein [Ruminiclostridium sp.]
MTKLFKFLKPYWLSIVAITVLVFTQVLVNLNLPTLMASIIDKGISQKDKAFTVNIFGFSGSYKGVDFIIRIGILMLLISAAGALCSIVASYLSSKTAVGFGRILRNKIFTKVEGFSLHEFDKVGTATLITRTTNDVTQVQQVTVMMFSIMLFAPLTCIGGFYMAIKEDKGLTWIFAIVIPLLLAIIGLTMKFGMPMFKRMQILIDKLNQVVREGLTGIRVVRAFNRIDHEKERFDNANKNLMDNAIKINKLMAFLMPIMMLIMNLTSISIIWFGAQRVNTGSIQVGSLMAFMQYGMQILMSFLMISMVFIMIPRASASGLRISEVLDMVPDITDAPKTILANKASGYLEFKDVSFRYPGAEQPAISNVTFSAKPGELTAIIGGTGSGKSTLVSLIPRFYDVENGSVLVDGVDVREMSQESLRAKIGFVPQKNVLFSGTISENISYGKDNATLEEISHAAEVAQATHFISEMEGGLEHVMAQGGTNVSGGQKQRLSIARALVRKPEIYVFDDSFSALDFKTDARLRAALKKETADATVLIIAQRVATVMEADRIIVLDDGKIAGIGTHKELIKTCDVYHEIVASQLSEEELA